MIECVYKSERWVSRVKMEDDVECWPRFMELYYAGWPVPITSTDEDVVSVAKRLHEDLRQVLPKGSRFCGALFGDSVEKYGDEFLFVHDRRMYRPSHVNVLVDLAGVEEDSEEEIILLKEAGRFLVNGVEAVTKVCDMEGVADFELYGAQNENVLGAYYLEVVIRCNSIGSFVVFGDVLVRDTELDIESEKEKDL